MSKNLRVFYVALVVLALAGAGVVGLAVRSKRTAGIAGATGPVQMPAMGDATQLTALARPMMRGDSTAPITIMEFADYECPYCGTFAKDIEPDIREEFVATGKARFQFFDFPLVNTHEHAFLAARAARCAEDQQKFWEYHDALFVSQARWAPQKDPSPVFNALAAELGLDPGAFKTCLESDRHADVITASIEVGKQMGVDRTPTVIITPGRGIGQKVTPTIDDIRAAMEELATP